MKNNNRKNKLSLSTETLRSLADDKLTAAAGGYYGTQYSGCPPTFPANACHIRTPQCPQ